MTEEQQTTKNMTIKIDTVALEERLKSQYEEQLKAKDETIKALLSQEKDRLINEKERKQAEYVNSPKPAPQGGDTAQYESNSHRVHFPIDIANSDIDPSWIKGKDEADVINQTEQLAKMGNTGCRKILNILGKRVLKSGIDIEFQGESRLLLKHDLPISEFDSESVKLTKQAYNQKLRENRLKWHNLQVRINEFIN
jgi:hypothetical protein